MQKAKQEIIISGQAIGAPIAGLGDDSAYKVYVQPLIDTCLNVHLLMMAEFKRLRYIPEKAWPFPAGYLTPMAPAYLAHISCLFPGAEEFGWDAFGNHELRDCTIAHFLPFILSGFDMCVRDDLKGSINFPSTEQLARIANPFEVAFRNCSNKSDWCKPPGGHHRPQELDI